MLNENKIKIDEATVFVKAFKWAMQSGMEIEFFISFIDYVNSGYGIIESIFYANSEWDL